MALITYVDMIKVRLVSSNKKITNQTCFTEAYFDPNSYLGFEFVKCLGHNFDIIHYYMYVFLRSILN